MNVIYIEGSRMTGRRQAHEYLSEKLSFPEYYGHNLDALADVLWELPADTCIVLLEEDALAENLGRYGETLIRVLTDAAASKHLKLIRFN